MRYQRILISIVVISESMLGRTLTQVEARRRPKPSRPRRLHLLLPFFIVSPSPAPVLPRRQWQRWQDGAGKHGMNRL